MGKSMETNTTSLSNIKYIKLNLDFLVSKYGFKIIDLSSSDSFGGSEEIILQSDDFYIKITKEREQYSFYFTNESIIHKDDWFDWDIVENFINENKKYVLKDYTEDFDYIYNTEYQLKKSNSEIEQIKKNFEKIINIFSDKNFQAILKILRKFENQRAKLLFG